MINKTLQWFRKPKTLAAFKIAIAAAALYNAIDEFRKEI